MIILKILLFIEHVHVLFCRTYNRMCCCCVAVFCTLWNEEFQLNRLRESQSCIILKINIGKHNLT